MTTIKTIHLQDCRYRDFVFDSLKSGKYNEVYLDATDKTEEQVLDEAWGLAWYLDKIPGLLRPIVVGPLNSLTALMDKRFAKKGIRTTGFTFAEYVKDTQ